MRQTIVNMAKLGGEVPKKHEGTCGTPIFFIAKPVLSNILLEGFPIRKYIWYLLGNNLLDDEGIRIEQVRVH